MKHSSYVFYIIYYYGKWELCSGKCYVVIDDGEKFSDLLVNIRNLNQTVSGVFFAEVVELADL